MLTLILRFVDPEDTFGSLWCSLLHNSLMWPIHGYYTCRRCGRYHRVPWAEVNSGRPVSASIAELSPISLSGRAARRSKALLQTKESEV